jgi:hypothetical protein
MRTALEWGLQRAACSGAEESACSIVVDSLSRRRLASTRGTKRRLQGDRVNVEFTVTSNFDVADAIAPTTLRSAFIASVTSAGAPPGLQSLSEDDFIVPDEPTSTTTIEYEVIMTDSSDVTDAAQVLNNPVMITTSLAESSGNADLAVTQITPPSSPSGATLARPVVSSVAPVDSSTVTEDPGNGGLIIGVVAVLLISGGGVAYFLISTKGVPAGKTSETTISNTNPMFAEDEDEENQEGAD